MTPSQAQTNDSNSDGLKRVEEKLDRLIDGLPKTYVTQAETDRRFMAIEALIKVVQSQIDGWSNIYRQEKNWAINEHQGVQAAISESERRITNKIDDNTKTTRGNRLVTWISIGGWILTIIVFTIGTIITHLWH